jgi:hypothetical protein
VQNTEPRKNRFGIRHAITAVLSVVALAGLAVVHVGLDLGWFDDLRLWTLMANNPVATGLAFLALAAGGAAWEYRDFQGDRWKLSLAFGLTLDGLLAICGVLFLVAAIVR